MDREENGMTSVEMTKFVRDSNINLSLSAQWQILESQPTNVKMFEH